MKILSLAVCPKRVLLIGAGRAAALKARTLRASDCALEIMSREIADTYFTPAEVRQTCFSLAWLEARQAREDAFDIIVNATGDSDLSCLLWENRRRLRYWMNAVDMPAYCDFYFGAEVRNHDLCVSVSTGGASPRYAQYVRDCIAAMLPRREQAFYDDLRRSRTSSNSRIDFNDGNPAA
jgi:uroporphyrin-III C-methyltransferase/precorrin-2 dehydrogenase/sirohydrochlorin ferrochelatase